MNPSRTAVSAAASAAVVLTAVTWGTSHSARAAETLTLEFRESSPVAVTDDGKPGPSAGDALMFRGALSGGGWLVARADLAGPRAALFTTTLRIPGRGTLAAQGRLDFQKSHQGSLAVLGGTGDFAGAAGSIDVVADQRERVTLTLVLE